MKLMTLILGALLTISAHASVNEFEGHYQVVSGDTSYGSCQDFDVVYDTSRETLKVINSKSNYVVTELGSINQGEVEWIKDLGDIVFRGTKKVVYDGKGQISYVTKKRGIFTYEKYSMKLSGDVLTITSNKKVCVLKR